MSRSSGSKDSGERVRNKEFARVTYFFVILFIALMGYLVYFMVVRAKLVVNSPYNQRQDAYADTIIRGSIVDKNGNVLAQTVIGDDGSETREYPYGEVFAHVIGYSNSKLGTTGLESVENFELLTSNAFFLEKLQNEFSEKKNRGDTVVTTLDANLQQAAYDALLPKLEDDAPHSALLYGVTGSGKTLVFLKLIARCLEQGRRALVLVPEISLTPQMILRLKSQFGRRVAVQHSALNHTERLLQWQMIQDGGADIVVGTRSAIFSPLENIGLIIIDEEQEHTYRSESAPRYSAHEVARQRAAENGALLLLASATPSTESFYAAQHGRTQLVRLTQRYGGNPLPTVQIVDMRAELAAGNPREISLSLEDAIRRNLDAGKQTILLLNRRGYQTMAQCEDCREVLKCTKCSVPMVYHKAAHKVLCHYCGSQMEPPTVCPTCGGKLQYRGFGTQKAEEELAKLFPDARVLRMDQDSTAAKDAHEKLLARFANHEYDIMVGTQMVAKGLDFEDVTLVGVLGIDSLLFAQGFRAYENVFSLITQVVGRSGRARDPGFAIIQTTDPDNPVLNLAAAQDYDAFFEQEIAYRKLGLYPPFCGLCVIGFAGAKEIEVARAAARFAALLGQQAAKQPDLPLRVLGPTPGSIEKINDTYRYKLTIKCRNDRRFRDLVRSTLERYEQEKLPSKATVAVDLHSDGDI